MALLIFLLIIAGIIIYKLNDKVEDDKVIKSNYLWKDRIQTLEGIIEHLEKKEIELQENGKYKEINRYRDEIENYKDEILKLSNNIYNNEKYLKGKGRI